MKTRKVMWLILILVVGYFIVMKAMSMNTVCVFKNLTGIPCPGCGMTRAFLELCRGNFMDSLIFHPLLLLVLILGLLSFISIWSMALRNFLRNNRFWTVIIVVFVLTYLVRMFLFFPDIPPMDFEKKSLYILLKDFF